MIDKIKNLGIVLTIAILFSIFVFSFTSAIYPSPDYDDFCDKPIEIPKPIDREKCGDLPIDIGCEGPVEYTYDEDGCPVKAKCNECFAAFDAAEDRYRMILFIVASIAGVAAILFGLYYNRKDQFWDLAKAGFLIGGLISVFVGTAFYYENMARFLKPAVILIELIIVLVVTYRIIKK